MGRKIGRGSSRACGCLTLREVQGREVPPEGKNRDRLAGPGYLAPPLRPGDWSKRVQARCAVGRCEGAGPARGAPAGTGGNKGEEIPNEEFRHRTPRTLFPVRIFQTFRQKGLLGRAFVG